MPPRSVSLLFTLLAYSTAATKKSCSTSMKYVFKPQGDSSLYCTKRFGLSGRGASPRVHWCVVLIYFYFLGDKSVNTKTTILLVDILN